MLVYAGGYGSDGTQGISCWRVGEDRWELAHPVTPAVDASFLAWHPNGRYLYAVSESAGRLLAFAVAGDGGLTPVNDQSTGGVDPCHLAVDPSGRYVTVANYGDGAVTVHPIGADGGVLPYTDLVKHSGSGPVPERQDGPHAHMTIFAPPGESSRGKSPHSESPRGESPRSDAPSLFVTDLGTDTVHEYQLVDGVLTGVDACMLTEGTGPRHLAFHPSGQVFVAGELDSTIEICRFSDGRLRPVAQLPASVATPEVDNLPSHLECSADGRFVYLANRGLDCVTTFEVLPDGLRAVADTPTGGAWPRHFALLGDLMLVANQDSDVVTVLRVDPRTGVPAPAHLRIDVAKPTCVLPALI